MDSFAAYFSTLNPEGLDYRPKICERSGLSCPDSLVRFDDQKPRQSPARSLGGAACKIITLAVSNMARDLPERMILSFAGNATKFIFGGEPTPEFPPQTQSTVQGKLVQTDPAKQLSDLLVPSGNRLEALK